MEQSHDLAAGVADQAMHAEARVESLQAQLWSGAFDLDSFVEGLRLACEAGGVSVPALPLIDPPSALYERALALAGDCSRLPGYGSLTLELELELEHLS